MVPSRYVKYVGLLSVYFFYSEYYVEIFRIQHVILNINVRFYNRLLPPVWSREKIDVIIDF
jgi:hypothetical protein